MRAQAEQIIHAALNAVQPHKAVQRALEDVDFPGRVMLVAVG